MNDCTISSGGMMEQIAQTMISIEMSESVWNSEKCTDPNSCWCRLAQKSVNFDAPQNLFLPEMSSWFYSLWMENKFSVQDIFRTYVKFQIGNVNPVKNQTTGNQYSSGLSRQPLRSNSNFINQNKNDHPLVNPTSNNNYLIKQKTTSNEKCPQSSIQTNMMNPHNSLNRVSTQPIPNCQSRQSTSCNYHCGSSPDFSAENKNHGVVQPTNNDNETESNLWMYEDPCISQETINSIQSPTSDGSISSVKRATQEQSDFPYLEDEPLIYPGSQFIDSNLSHSSSQNRGEEGGKENTGSLLNTSSSSQSVTNQLGEKNNSDDNNLISSGNKTSVVTTPIPVFGDFTARDANKLLNSKNGDNLSTGADFTRIKTQTAFLFDTRNAQEAYWLNDGEEWKIDKTRAVPWKHPIVESRVYTLKRNGERKSITKIEYWCLGGEKSNWKSWNNQRVVVHYKGALSSLHFPRSSTSEANADCPIYSGIPQKTKKSSASTLTIIDENIKNGLKGKRLHKKLSFESERLEVQGKAGYELKNTRQIYNRQQAIKRNQPIYDNDIGDLCGIGKEFPSVLPSIRINPSTFVVSSHPELHHHLDEFHSLSDGFVFHYDTTFSCGPFFVSILSVRHPALVQNPAIPVSVLYHEYQDGLETHKPFFEVVSKSLKCLNKANNLFISDREKGIKAAATDVLSNMNYVYCFNHIRVNVRDWTFKTYTSDKKYARSLQLDIKRLLWMKSLSDFDDYVKSRCCLEDGNEDDIEEEEEDQVKGFIAVDENGKPYPLEVGAEEEEELSKGLKRWDSKFQKYFTRHLEKDLRACFRGVIKMKGTFNLNSGVTNNASESLNDVTKNHLFEPEEVKTIFGLVKYIHEWQSVILLDIHKAFKGQPSNYKVKPEFQNKLSGLSQIKVPDSSIIFSDEFREVRLPKKKQRIDDDINFSIKEKMAKDAIEKGKVKLIGDGFFSVEGAGKKYLVHPLNNECTCVNTRCYHRIAASMAAGVYDHPKCQFLKEIKPTTVTDVFKKTRPKRCGKKGSNLLRVPQKFDDELEDSGSSICNSSGEEDEETGVCASQQQDESSASNVKSKPTQKFHQSMSCPASSSTSGLNPVQSSTSSVTTSSTKVHSSLSIKKAPESKSASTSNSRNAPASKAASISKIKKPPAAKSNPKSKPIPKSKSNPKSKQGTLQPNLKLTIKRIVAATNKLATELSSPHPPSPEAESVAPSLKPAENKLSSGLETSTKTQVATTSSSSSSQLPIPAAISTSSELGKKTTLPKITTKNGYVPLLEINSHTLTLRELKTLTGLDETEKKSLQKDKKYASLLSHDLWLSDGILFLYLELIKHEKTEILNYPQAQRIFTPEKSGLDLRIFSDVSGIKFGQWMDSELGFIMYHQNQNHWILLAAKLHEQTVYVMDPKNEWQPSYADKSAVDNCLNKARGILDEKDMFPWTFETINCPLQEDVDNCGPFVLHFAASFQNGRTTLEKPPEDFRIKILNTLVGCCDLALKLKNGKKSICNICLKSTPGKSKANWLQCKRCLQWVHEACDLRCRDDSSLLENYIC